MVLGGDEELGGIDVGKCLLQCFALFGSDLVGFVEEENELFPLEGRGKRAELRASLGNEVRRPKEPKATPS